MTELEIVERFLQIPEERRRQLMESLKNWRAEYRQKVMQTYINFMIDIVGEGLLSKSRDSELVDARAVVSYVLHKKGYSENEIAGELNKNHSMIHIYIDQTEFDLVHDFRNYRTRLYKKYTDKLSEYAL